MFDKQLERAIDSAIKSWIDEHSSAEERIHACMIMSSQSCKHAFGFDRTKYVGGIDPDREKQLRKSICDELHRIDANENANSYTSLVEKYWRRFLKPDEYGEVRHEYELS